MISIFIPFLGSNVSFLWIVVLVCVLEADLVDSFNPGDDVVVVGVLLRRWKPVFEGSRCQLQCSLRANR